MNESDVDHSESQANTSYFEDWWKYYSSSFVQRVSMLEIKARFVIFQMRLLIIETPEPDVTGSSKYS